MMAGVVPAFTGFMVMALLPNEDAYRWSKWGGYFMSVTFVLPLFLSWSLLSSNVSGRTKKSVANIFTFICYCVSCIHPIVGKQHPDDPTHRLATWLGRKYSTLRMR